MANTRNYSNTAVSTTLNGSITNVGTSVVLTAQTGMPTPPFLLCLEPDTANEELVLVNSGAGTGGSPYVVVRGQDGTTNIAHNSLVVAQHRVAAVDFTDSRTHEAASANIHGLNGASISVNGGTSSVTSSVTYGNASGSDVTISKSFSIAGNSLAAGSTYRVTAWGTMGSTATPTLTVKLKYGSTVLATAVVTFTTGGIATSFVVTAYFNAQTVGGSGNLAGSVSVITNGNSTNPAQGLPVNSAALVTGISTTSSQNLLLTGQWSATSASNTMTTLGSVVEQLF